MPRVRLVVEYDGTDFCGWQLQPERRTVQGTLEAAVERLTCRPVRVHGSGRTDAGVHAMGQVAHLDVAGEETARVLEGLDRVLPGDVSVRKAAVAAPDFDARRDAVERLYGYRILRRRRPLLDRYAHVDGRGLDTGAMARAASLCRGISSWRGMAKEGSGNTGWKADVRTCEVAEDALGWTFLISANRFLRGMVRLWAGTLTRVGLHALSPGGVRDILDTGDRSSAGPALPAKGLTLIEVRYPEDSEGAV
jgi:tRNA pseudouridine38-40 synthase